MKKWQRKIVDMLRGWCPKVKEPKTSHFSLARTLKIKEVMRENILLTVGFLVAVIVLALFLVVCFSTPRAPLKQNMYERSFSDMWGSIGLDVIIHYETEADDTWSRSSEGKYNITVLLKPTYVNESVISKFNVIHWGVGGGPISITGGWPYLTEEPAPIDYGLDLMSFWLNQSVWCVVSQVYHLNPSHYPPGIQDQSILTFGFMIREVLTNGTTRLFNMGDFLSVEISG